MTIDEQLAPILESLAADGVLIELLPRIGDEFRVRVKETSDCDMCVLDTPGLEHFLAEAVQQATGEPANVRVIERTRVAPPSHHSSTGADW
jgi:hypothetical protein